MLKSHKKTILEALGRNTIHPFPARMAAGIALDVLGRYKDVKPLRVLDPMAGSGTVLAVARTLGHEALGIDLDPLAVLLAGVWTRTVNAHTVREMASEVLATAKQKFDLLSVRQSYPSESDEETRKFIRYWFDGHARRQLVALSSSINIIRDPATRDLLWCALSRLIITKNSGASLAKDLSHSRPHRHFSSAPMKPFDRFISAVDAITKNCPQAASSIEGPPAVVNRGDARQMDIASNSIDLIVTSPPYLNAIDYIRCSKFSLVWMGYKIGELRRIRGDIVGAQASCQKALDSEWVSAIVKCLKLSPKLSSRDNGLLARYVWDMGNALRETARVLRPGGRAVYVVGDSTVRNTFIRNSLVVVRTAQLHGLSIISRRVRDLPANRRYMPPPKGLSSKAPMDTRMRKEVVLEFEKPHTLHS